MITAPTHRVVVPAIGAAITAAVVALALAAPLAPAFGGDPERPGRGATRSPASASLGVVRSLFDGPAGAGARVVPDGGGVDATLALRDLARHVDDLPEPERAQAERYLARPTTPDGDDVGGAVVRYDVAEESPACSRDLCVHYVATTRDAPPLTDTLDAAGAAGPNGVPDHVDTVLRVMTDVHETYLRAGYREPRGDGERGGGRDLIDVYLADIGALGLYGYCTTDQPNPPRGAPPAYDRWAYCTLDDDYAEFPDTPLRSLQITAAHEYFHAVQYAYDAFEDAWLLEATATWAEDELYDDVDDNVQYLRRSPMTAPFVPLDAFIDRGRYRGFHYGTWSFVRYLTERFPEQRGGLPRLVLDLMEQLDGSQDARNLYSWRGVQAVLARQGTTAAEQFLGYSVDNRRPKLAYAEGRSQRYPTGPLRGSITLSPQHQRTGPATVALDHLTSATYRISPERLATSSTRLRIDLDMTPRRTGSVAAVAVVARGGRARVRPVELSSSGAASLVVPFDSRSVRHVEVTMANGSGRTRCSQDALSPYSCFGVPVDDALEQVLQARLVR